MNYEGQVASNFGSRTLSQDLYFPTKSVSSSFFNSGTCHVTHVKDLVINHGLGKTDWVVTRCESYKCNFRKWIIFGNVGMFCTNNNLFEKQKQEHIPVYK